MDTNTSTVTVLYSATYTQTFTYSFLFTVIANAYRRDYIFEDDIVNVDIYDVIFRFKLKMIVSRRHCSKYVSNHVDVYTDIYVVT